MSINKYDEGYKDGFRAGMENISCCMHMMVDEAKCTSHQYYRGFEAGFRQGLAKHGKVPAVSGRCR